jgi:chemotaxis protein MotA
MRGLTTLLGMIIGVASAAYVIFATGVDVGVFFDANGFIMVTGETVAAIFLSFSMQQINRIIKITTQIFLRTEDPMKFSATTLMQYCKSVKEGGISNAKTDGVHPFVFDCITLLKDNYKNEDARSILVKRIISLSEQEGYDINLLKSMAKYPPAFGMLGTVIGLIALMAKIGEGLSPDQVGLYMAIALTTTMYGVAFANLIFKPLADNLQMRSIRNTKKRQMVLDAVLLTWSNVSLIVVQDTVNSYLSPSDRIDIFGGGDNRAAA